MRGERVVLPVVLPDWWGCADRLAKECLLEREPGGGIEERLGLAPEWKPGETRAGEPGLGLRRGLDLAGRPVTARRREAREEGGVLGVVEAAVRGGALAGPGPVGGGLGGQPRGQVVQHLEPAVAEGGRPGARRLRRALGRELPERQGGRGGGPPR